VNFHRDLMQPAQLMSEAEGLIARYPSLHQFEVDRLVDIYPRLSNVDVALMISDDDLGPRIESFVRGERHRLRMPLQHLLGLLSPFLLFLMVMAWIAIS
jgi:hypothetical protein